MKRAWLAWLCLSACAPVAQEPVSLELAAEADLPAEILTPAGTVRFRRAQLALGPAWFCATAAAGADQCETPLLEATSTGVVDLLRADPQVVARVEGVTGSVRSMQYDHGVPWLLTDPGPRAREGAPGGHSLLLGGEISGNAGLADFVIRVDVVANRRGESAVAFLATEADVTTRTTRVTMVVPALAWVTSVDFQAVADEAAMNQGVADVGPDHAAVRAVPVMMTSTARPLIEWTQGE